MSRNEKNGKTVDMDFSALDLELAQIAEETPDVPEDFHAQWTQAIRKEAAARQGEETAPEAGKAELRKADARKQRRYILSAAAAFVLIIGGVWLLLGKDGVDKLSADNPFSKLTGNNAPVVQEGTVTVSETDTVPEPETTAAQEEVAEETAAAPEEAVGEMATAPEEAVGEMATAPEEAAEETAAAPEEAAEETPETPGADMNADGAAYEAAANTAGEVPAFVGEAVNKAAAKSSEDTGTTGEIEAADGDGEVYEIEDYGAPVMYAAMQAMGAAVDYAEDGETEAAYGADRAYEAEEAANAEAKEAEEEDALPEEPAATPEPKAEPTTKLTAEPTAEPTAKPTAKPTAEPTTEPKAELTEKPTPEPTAEPTAEPTEKPTAEPTAEPTEKPTPEPTAEPTAEPKAELTAEPTAEPTAKSGSKAAVTAEKEEENVSFLQRVWNWVLQVTPWALAIIVVVLFLVTYVLRIIQRRRKQNGEEDGKDV